MKVEIIPFELQFQNPFPFPLEPFPVQDRKGFYVVVTDQEGRRGWGECAPFPGSTAEELTGLQNEFQRGRPNSPAARRTWEQVQYHLRFQRLGPLGGEGLAEVPLNALVYLPAEEKDVESLALWILERNYSSVKVKIGRKPLTEEIRDLRRLHLLTGEKLSFRLDPQGALSWEEFQILARGVEGLPLEYVEDPFHHPELWRKHARWWSGACPLAADEVVRNLWDTPAFFPFLDEHRPTLVLKPNLLPGWDVTHELMVLAKERELGVVLSSTFDSSLTLEMLGIFSQILGPNPLPQGLATHHFLSFEVKEVKNDSVPNLGGAIPKTFLSEGHRHA